MRFNNPRNEYPLPILRPDGNESNYIHSDFIVDVNVEAESSPNQIEIQHEIKQPDIKCLVSSKRATLSLAVHCDDTYFYDLIDLADKQTQTVNLSEKSVFGKVYFTLIVKAIKDVGSFKPGNLQAGFDGLIFDVRKGDMLAISDEYVEYYHLPPVYLGENIFELVEEPGLADLAFEVDPTEQKINIGVGVELNKLIQRNMATSAGRVNNICSIYLPVLMEVLFRVKSESFTGDAWYEAVKTSLSGVGMDIEDEQLEPLRAAQALLKYPYQSLLNRV